MGSVGARAKPLKSNSRLVHATSAGSSCRATKRRKPNHSTEELEFDSFFADAPPYVLSTIALPCPTVVPETFEAKRRRLWAKVPTQLAIDRPPEDQ